MPYFKDDVYFIRNSHTNFDAHNARTPGMHAPDGGVYRCTGCGHEIGIARGHALPPQNHHQHSNYSIPIRWQLVAAAIENGSP